MTLLVAADLVAITLVTCAMAALPAMSRPTLPFGVRVAADRVADPAIVAQRRTFTRLVVLAAVVAAAGSVAAMAVLGHAGVVVATAALLGVVDLALYYRGYRRIRAAKRLGGWQAEHRQGTTVDTSFRTDPVRVPLAWLTPAVLVLLLSAGLGWWLHGGLPATLGRFTGFGVDPAQRQASTTPAVFEPVLYQLAVVVLFPLLAMVLLRARPDLDAARPAGSARRYRSYLRGVARQILLLAAAVDLGLAISALQLWEVLPASTFWRAATYVPLASAAIGWLVWERRVGQAGHRLPAEPGEDEEDTGVVQRDDDRNWFLGGMVYVNRRDPALLVHRRVGTYWTLNVGHPVAWVLLAVLAGVTLLALTGAIDVPQKESVF